MDRTQAGAELTGAIAQVRTEMRAVATDDAKRARLAQLEGWLDQFAADIAAAVEGITEGQVKFYGVKDAKTLLTWYRLHSGQRHSDTWQAFIRLIARKL